MGTTLGLLLGVLLSCWIGLAGRKKDNGDKCTHHSECYSDCCLMNLEFGGAFCASKAAKSTPCLPQTKGALNIMCPCRLGLTCVSRDLMCPRRCHWI